MQQIQQTELDLKALNKEKLLEFATNAAKRLEELTAKNEELQQRNEDLQADYEAVMARAHERGSRATGRPRGLPAGLSKLDLKAWKESTNPTPEKGSTLVQQYQKAVEEGTWVPKFKVGDKGNRAAGAGRGKGPWGGRRTTDQNSAMAGGWPSRAIWQDGIDSLRMTNGQRPNFNFDDFVTSLANPKDNATEIAGQVFFAKHPSLRPNQEPQD